MSHHPKCDLHSEPCGTILSVTYDVNHVASF